MCTALCQCTLEKSINRKLPSGSYYPLLASLYPTFFSLHISINFGKRLLCPEHRSVPAVASPVCNECCRVKDMQPSIERILDDTPF